MSSVFPLEKKVELFCGGTGLYAPVFYGVDFFQPLFNLSKRGVIVLLAVGLNSVSAAQTTAETSEKALANLVASGGRGSEFQLEVRHMPMAEVLKSIADKTKVPIHYSVLPEGLVTATCVGATLKPVLECLLDRKADLIVRYARSEGKADNKEQVAEAWVLGSRFDGAEAKNECRVIGGKEASISLSQNLPDAETQSKHDQSDILLKIAKSKNARDRAEAIGAILAIGRKGDSQIQAMLEEAIHDEDENVRAQAVSTLTHWSNDDASIAAALQEALHDSSVDVRLMAVDGITDDIGLLQQAINDSDESVRSLAAVKLEELTQGNKTKP